MDLLKLGWNDRFDSLFEPFRRPGLAPARVTSASRGLVSVTSCSGEAQAATAGRLEPGGDDGPPAVGDWVALDTTTDTAVVRAILERSSSLARRAAGSNTRHQIVAANVDLVLVVEPLDRGPNPRRIERAVALAWDGGATPLVVLTKTDLAENVADALEIVSGAAPWVDTIAATNARPDSLAPLVDHLDTGTTAVLLGPSGAGKSTLVNLLLGEERFATRAVRDSDRKGRHTTTHRELVQLPSGGCLIDTPGIRELGLWLAADAVDAAFPDIEALAGDCRFRDCRHEHEPGCAVRAAVDDERLARDRLAGYHRLRHEAAALERRVDPTRRHEARARDRSFGKLIRAVQRHKEER